MNYDNELGDLREADWGALATDARERPPDRRRRPAPSPAVEERNRREARERAEFRARSIANVAWDVTLDELAERLGIDVRLVEEVAEYAHDRRPLRPETLHALGVQGRRRPPRSEMLAELGEGDFEEIAGEFAREVAGQAPECVGSDVTPLARTQEELAPYLDDLAEADREHVA